MPSIYNCELELLIICTTLINMYLIYIITVKSKSLYSKEINNGKQIMFEFIPSSTMMNGYFDRAIWRIILVDLDVIKLDIFDKLVKTTGSRLENWSRESWSELD